jgi:competence protein ComEC
MKNIILFLILSITLTSYAQDVKLKDLIKKYDKFYKAGEDKPYTGECIDYYEIGQKMLTGVQHKTDWYSEILEEIAAQEIPIILADSSTDLEFSGGVSLDIFWPEKNLTGKTVSDANAASIAAKLIFGETKAILTGDLDLDSEKIILKNNLDLKAQILKLGHHGSKTSSSIEFLEAIQPDFAIVSASADNSFGHPSPEVLNRLNNSVQTLETSKLGSIHFISDGLNWQLGE